MSPFGLVWAGKKRASNHLLSRPLSWIAIQFRAQQAETLDWGSVLDLPGSGDVQPKLRIDGAGPQNTCR
jgi:hypothetical protein